MGSPTAAAFPLSPLVSPLRRKPPRDPRTAPRVDIPKSLAETPYYEDYKVRLWIALSLTLQFIYS